MSTINASLAFLIPIGYALIAAAGLPAERTRHAAVSLFAALGLAAAGYVAVGFALQFGGVGLIHNLPGLEELIWEWSALGPAWGTGWGMAGLTGWGLTGPAATAGAFRLALANLPWVITAALIPVVGLRSRIPAWSVGLLGLLTGAIIYPLAGNWIWGGGWLANLGSNLEQGHGLVDAGGSGLTHLLAAAVALAGILVFLPRQPRSASPDAPTPLPRLYLPLLTALGAGLLLIGGTGWSIANPLLAAQNADGSRIALNWALAAAAGGLVPLFYTWFVAGTPDPLMAARGLAAGTVAIAAGAPFVAPWAALLIGGLAGLLTPLAIFLVHQVLRWDDPAAVLPVHGLAGALGLVAVGLFADGSAGLAWNGVGPDSYLGIAVAGRDRAVSGPWLPGRLAQPNAGAGGWHRQPGLIWLLRGLAGNRTAGRAGPSLPATGIPRGGRATRSPGRRGSRHRARTGRLEGDRGSPLRHAPSCTGDLRSPPRSPSSAGDRRSPLPGYLAQHLQPQALQIFPLAHRLIQVMQQERQPDPRGQRQQDAQRQIELLAAGRPTRPTAGGSISRMSASAALNWPKKSALLSVKVAAIAFAISRSWASSPQITLTVKMRCSLPGCVLAPIAPAGTVMPWAASRLLTSPANTWLRTISPRSSTRYSEVSMV